MFCSRTCPIANLPKLLAATLLDGSSDDVYPAGLHRAHEVGVVVHTYRDKSVLRGGYGGPEAGGGLDCRGVDAAVDDPPWLVVAGPELDEALDAVRAELCHLQSCRRHESTDTVERPRADRARIGHLVSSTAKRAKSVCAALGRGRTAATSRATSVGSSTPRGTPTGAAARRGLKRQHADPDSAAIPAAYHHRCRK
jgi:hypothetical protein